MACESAPCPWTRPAWRGKRQTPGRGWVSEPLWTLWVASVLVLLSGSCCRRWGLNVTLRLEPGPPVDPAGNPWRAAPATAWRGRLKSGWIGRRPWGLPKSGAKQNPRGRPQFLAFRILEREPGRGPRLLSFLPSRPQERRVDAPPPSLFAGGNFPVKDAERIWFLAAGAQQFPPLTLLPELGGEAAQCFGSNERRASLPAGCWSPVVRKPLRPTPTF